MERIVRTWLCWTAAVMLWATASASAPAPVDNANWGGRQTAAMGSAYVWAKQRATSRRSRSPTMIALTLPWGFCKATRRPSPSALVMSRGTSALAIWLATVMNDWVVCSSSSTNRKVSAVRPDGPGAAPSRARRRLVSSWLAGRSGSGCQGQHGPRVKLWRWHGQQIQGPFSATEAEHKVACHGMRVD